MSILFYLPRMLVMSYHLSMHKTRTSDMRDVEDYMNDVLSSEEYKKFEREIIIPQSKVLSLAIVLTILSCAVALYLF